MVKSRSLQKNKRSLWEMRRLMYLKENAKGTSRHLRQDSRDGLCGRPRTPNSGVAFGARKFLRGTDIPVLRDSPPLVLRLNCE